MEVQMVSQKLIKPSSTIPTHDHNITFFDQLAPHLHVRLIFFYSSSDQSNDHDSNINNLHTSLSETLNLYPPFAGRFKEDGLTVSCGSQGVPFSEALVNEKLDEFLVKVQNDRTLLSPFVPQDLGEAKSIKTPMLAIQATSFKCGGLALGIARSHALADAYSSVTFFHHWAALNRGRKDKEEEEEEKIHLPDFHSAYELFPPNMLPIPQPSLLKVGNKKIVKKTLVFSGDAIVSLKAKLVSSKNISRVVIVMGTIWRALINISRAKNNGHLTRPSILTLTFSLRGRNALTSKKTFGNLYIQVPIRFSEDENINETDELLLGHLVSLIGDGIKTVVVAFSKASTCHEIASLALKLHNEVNEALVDERVDVFPFTSWCKFDPSVIDVDFGRGKPTWVGMLFKSQMNVLMDTKCGTGIEAGVHLNEVDMAEFECDPGIKQFI